MCDLLRSCSWHAERLLKKRGEFDSVVLVVEYADSRREFYELECSGAPADASNRRFPAPAWTKTFGALVRWPSLVPTLRLSKSRHLFR